MYISVLLRVWHGQLTGGPGWRQEKSINIWQINISITWIPDPKKQTHRWVWLNPRRCKDDFWQIDISTSIAVTFQLPFFKALIFSQSDLEYFVVEAISRDAFKLHNAGTIDKCMLMLVQNIFLFSTSREYSQNPSWESIRCSEIEFSDNYWVSLNVEGTIYERPCKIT